MSVLSSKGTHTDTSTAALNAALSSLSHSGHRLLEYVSELSKAEVDTLYADAACARVIFREAVPPVAQQLIMRLVFGGARPFQESVLKRWCAAVSLPHTAYLSILQQLQILVPQKAVQKPGQPGPGQLLMLHKSFQSSLAAFLQGEAWPHGPHGPHHSGEAEAPPGDVLMQHAVSSWDAFLQQLLEPGLQSDLADLTSKLNFKDESGLTAAGFEFVLDERQQQLWCLVISYLKAVRENQSPLGLLRTILAMGELGIGKCLTGAEALEQQFLRFLAELGVLYEEREHAEHTEKARFWTTPGALALFRRDMSQKLSRSIGGGAGEASEEQGLIVESNFKVYGYTSSPLHALLLGHFCEILVRLPNLVVGQLTAESVLKAMSHGIRAAHMLRYLEAAAHPRQRAREGEGSSVPSNVRGQLEARRKAPCWARSLPLPLFVCFFFSGLSSFSSCALHSSPSRDISTPLRASSCVSARRSGSPVALGQHSPQRFSSSGSLQTPMTPSMPQSSWPRLQERRSQSC